MNPTAPVVVEKPPEALQPRLLARIAGLLWVIVLALVMAFCFFAGSFCVTLLLAAFLAILADPIISHLEGWHISRTMSSALLIFAGIGAFALIGYKSYNQIVGIVDTIPQYADRIRNLTMPIARQVEKVQESAQQLTPEQPSKKVAEVKVKPPPVSWPSYVIRGVGPVWGAVIIVGVVPFMMFFFLVRKEQMYERLETSLGAKIDVPRFVTSVKSMVRGFAVGNLVIGSAMAAITVVVLYALHLQGAVILGILSGFLNLVPFIGVILAAVLPLGAALLQFDTPAPLAIISVTVIVLHIISANLLIPKIIGSRVNIGPAAATAGILFWGWLWGPIGVLLAVPLTATVKLVADSHPSLIHLSNLLAESPRPMPAWIYSSTERFYRAVPYLRRKSPAAK